MNSSYDHGQSVVNNTQRLIDNLFLIKIPVQINMKHLFLVKMLRILLSHN